MVTQSCDKQECIKPAKPATV